MMRLLARWRSWRARQARVRDAARRAMDGGYRMSPAHYARAAREQPGDQPHRRPS